MKQYLFSLFISTSLITGYAYESMALSPDYETGIKNVQNMVEKNNFSAETKQEMQALLNSLLKNIQSAQKEGKNIDILEQRDSILNERNTQLEKENPEVFQKLFIAGDTIQWFNKCTMLVNTLTEKLNNNKNTVLSKLIDLMRYVNQNSSLAAAAQQEREKFLTVFEQKLKAVDENIDIIGQAEQTFTTIRQQWEGDNSEQTKKMISVADAHQFFIDFTNYIDQSPQNLPQK